MHKRLHDAPRASKKKKGEDWQNDFTEFFARQEQGGWGGKSVASDIQAAPRKDRKRGNSLIVFPKPVFFRSR